MLIFLFMVTFFFHLPHTLAVKAKKKGAALLSSAAPLQLFSVRQIYYLFSAMA